MQSTQKNQSERILNETMDLVDVEKSLRDKLKNCAIWGEINIGCAEHERITEMIARKLSPNPTPRQLIQMFYSYPVILVTDMIFFVLYDYNNKDFWSSWARRYQVKVNVNHQREIGHIVQGLFDQHQFEVVDEGHEYVTPILCQAGIPNVCLDDLFAVLYTTLGAFRFFNEQEFVNELIGARNYRIDSTVERYLTHHRERACALIVKLREMMHGFGTKDLDITDLPEISDVPRRIVERYAVWRTEIKSQGRKYLKKIQYFAPPKLIFDDMKGVCLYIPEQTLLQEAVNKLFYTIISDGDTKNIKKVTKQVFYDHGRNFTRESYTQVDCANMYMVELSDDYDYSNEANKTWPIESFSKENKVLTFNWNGTLMKSTERILAKKGTVVVLNPGESKIVGKHKINIVEIDLPQAWSDFQAFRVYPFEKDAYLEIKTDAGCIHLDCPQSFEIDLISVDTLFGEKYTEKDTPVYICFPAIEISGLSQISFSELRVEIIHFSSNNHCNTTLAELPQSVDGNSLRFKLTEIAAQHFLDDFGLFQLRIFSGKARKEFEAYFYISPNIPYRSVVEKVESDRDRAVTSAHFSLQKAPGVDFEFPSGGIKKTSVLRNGVEWLEFSTKKKPPYIAGNIVLSGDYHIPFKKTIRELSWSFWAEDEDDFENIGVSRQFYIDELTNKNWRLVLHFTDISVQYDTVRLVLEKADSTQLQTKDNIKVDIFGKCSISMSVFNDTIRANELPQRLMLYLSKGFDDYLPICVAKIKSRVQLKAPKYFEQGGPVIAWQNDESNNYENKRFELKSLLALPQKTLEYSLNNITEFTLHGDQYYEGIELQENLDSGAYIIDVIEEDEDFFFDEKEYSIPTFDEDHLLCVNGNQTIKTSLADKTQALSWLKAAVTAMHRTDWIAKVAEILKNYIELDQHKIVFDATNCSGLLFLLIINSGPKSAMNLETKKSIKEIYRLINDEAVLNTDRTELLVDLLERDASEEDCRMIIEELQLYLFCPKPEVVFDKDSVRKMWDINEKLAILMNVRNSVSDVSVDLQRVLGRLGEDMEKIIQFSTCTKMTDQDWVECTGRLIGRQCNCSKVKFDFSTRVWGDVKEYEAFFTEFVLLPVYKKKPRDIPNIKDIKSQGYNILGKNYLTLLWEILNQPVLDDERKKAEENTERERQKVEELMRNYEHLIHELKNVLRKREEGNVDSHRVFYQIGCASALVSLSTKNKLAPIALQILLPFFRNAATAYSDLVYRDLILAELYMECTNKRSG